MGLPLWLSSKESACQCRRHGFKSLDLEDLWRREWQPTRVLAWRIPWTEEAGGLQSMGSQRVRGDLPTKQQQHYFCDAI